MLDYHAVVPASPMVIPMAIPGVLLLLLFSSSSSSYQKKIYSIFFQVCDLVFDGAHDVMLAKQWNTAQRNALLPVRGVGFSACIPGF